MLFTILMAMQVPQSPAMEEIQYLPIPMTRGAWEKMDDLQKAQYADITIQGLRRNSFLAECQNLTTENLLNGLKKEDKNEEILVMALARVAYGLCL